MKIVNFKIQTPAFRQKGFAVLETLIYVTIFVLVFLMIAGFIFWFNYSNSRSKADRELLENSRDAIEAIVYEIKGAESVYTPTSSQNQLSLKTSNYLPSGEESSYIDFFVCGSRVCFKKEGQSPVFLTPESIQVSNLEFTQISANGAPCVQVRLAVDYTDSSGVNSSIELTSTASLRSY